MMERHARDRLIDIDSHDFDIMICIYDKFGLKCLVHGFIRLYVIYAWELFCGY